MTRVQRREDVARHHPRIKRLTTPRDKAETTSATIPSHECRLRSARRKAMRYRAAHSQSEFHHTATRAVKQRTNQSHAAKIRPRAASVEPDAGASDRPGIVTNENSAPKICN